MEKNRPLKDPKLKIIDYVGVLYATFDGERVWEIDKVSHEILKMCDGKKTVNEIAGVLSKQVKMDLEKVKIGLKGILNKLEGQEFIKYV